MSGRAYFVVLEARSLIGQYKLMPCAAEETIM